MVATLAITSKGFWPRSATTQPAYLPLNGIITTNTKTGTVVLS